MGWGFRSLSKEFTNFHDNLTVLDDFKGSLLQAIIKDYKFTETTSRYVVWLVTEHFTNYPDMIALAHSICNLTYMSIHQVTLKESCG